MGRPSPYARHNDFYLLGLWQDRSSLGPDEQIALREEMGRRGLDTEDGDAAPSALALKGSRAQALQCPYCQQSMSAGRVGAGQADRSRPGASISFSPSDGGETVEVGPSKSQQGFFCGDCGTLVLWGAYAD